MGMAGILLPLLSFLQELLGLGAVHFPMAGFPHPSCPFVLVGEVPTGPKIEMSPVGLYIVLLDGIEGYDGLELGGYEVHRPEDHYHETSAPRAGRFFPLVNVKEKFNLYRAIRTPEVIIGHVIALPPFPSLHAPDPRVRRRPAYLSVRSKPSKPRESEGRIREGFRPRDRLQGEGRG